MPAKNEKTQGLKYDNEKPPMDLLSSIALAEIAKVLGYGKKKYSAHNWREGIAWSRIIAATLRHITAFNGGEDNDPETGISHVAHAACGLMFLLEYQSNKTDFDDRYKSKTPITITKGAVECAHVYKAPLSGDEYKCIRCHEELVWTATYL